MSDLTISIPSTGMSPFDTIRRTRTDGSEYWSARDLQPLMGYSQWRDFQTAMERAKLAAVNSGMNVACSFVHERKVAGQSPNPREDYELTRMAAYLVSLNGDPSKPESARAQAYFAVRTMQAERIEELTDEQFLARALGIARKVLAERETRIAELKPKAEIADKFLSASAGSTYIVEWAKRFGMTQNSMYQLSGFIQVNTSLCFG